MPSCRGGISWSVSRRFIADMKPFRMLRTLALSEILCSPILEPGLNVLLAISNDLSHPFVSHCLSEGGEFPQCLHGTQQALSGSWGEGCMRKGYVSCLCCSMRW